MKGVKIYAEDSADYLELLLRAVPAAARTDESFGAFVNALDDEQLARFAAPPVAEAAMSTPRAVPVLLPVLRRAGPASRRPDAGGDASRASGDSS